LRVYHSIVLPNTSASMYLFGLENNAWLVY